MKSSFLLFFCTFILIASTLAQDSITFISGRVMNGLVKDVDSLDIQFEFKKRKKTKVIYITKSSIFAIKYADGRTDILYEPMNEEEYSSREMELYIIGEQDAMRSSKTTALFVGGVLVGSVSAFGLGPFLGLAPPFGYAMVAGMLNKKVKEDAVSNPDLLREDTYLTGFVAKNKSLIIQRSIIGSIIGYLTGLACRAIYAELYLKDQHN